MGYCDQYATLWPAAEQGSAACICQHESGGNPSASNGADFGLFQIEASAQPDFDMTRWSDPAYNAQYARGLWQSSGWGPWTTASQCAGSAGASDSGGSASPAFSLPAITPGLGAVAALFLFLVLAD